MQPRGPLVLTNPAINPLPLPPMSDLKPRMNGQIPASNTWPSNLASSELQEPSTHLRHLCTPHTTSCVKVSITIYLSDPHHEYIEGVYKSTDLHQMERMVLSITRVAQSVCDVFSAHVLEIGFVEADGQMWFV